MTSHLRQFRFLILVALLLILSATFVGAQAGDQPEAYRNPDLPVADRVADLLGRMTLDEKIGQMTLVEKNSITPGDVTQLAIGGILSGGGGYPANGNSVETVGAMTSAFQQGALDLAPRHPDHLRRGCRSRTQQSARRDHLPAERRLGRDPRRRSGRADRARDCPRDDRHRHLLGLCPGDRACRRIFAGDAPTRVTARIPIS